ncbi:putative Alkaline phosphatase, tissue-nonspecific isozyme precursor [Penaeus vannamei]|uniref:alkaline phosphatase n=1 Tax=Penaeus vannamei TaxID=6689 RepID=A0A3R7QS87_PENVA|nr:putative Alkaline phosphatase, tissue-nonspecific isozyme precursor [Penaeus vannamei]
MQNILRGSTRTSSSDVGKKGDWIAKFIKLCGDADSSLRAKLSPLRSGKKGDGRKTYNIDAQVGGSSACATALMCGVKANVNTVGLDSRGKFEDCRSSFTAGVTSIIDWAQKHDFAIISQTKIVALTPRCHLSSPNAWKEGERSSKNSFLTRRLTWQKTLVSGGCQLLKTSVKSVTFLEDRDMSSTGPGAL